MKVSTFRADTHSVDNRGEYRDPLMKWPLRGAAFTNEVGEALRPLIGGYATLTWVPVLMYIGADVYDKYKNDETEYNPNSRRLLKQAIFQGLSSILLPIAAVKIGQGLFSQFGRLTKDKITTNSKETVSKVAEDFIANGQMRAFHNKDAECSQVFLDKVHNRIDFKRYSESSKNPITKFFNKIEAKIFKPNPELLDRYAKSTINDLIETRKKILNPTDEFKKTQVYKDYSHFLSKGQTSNVAIKSALINSQQRKMLKGRVVKTIGGFIALGLAIKPIDNFVENILIGKWVGPGIDKIEPKKSKIKD